MRGNVGGGQAQYQGPSEFGERQKTCKNETRGHGDKGNILQSLMPTMLLSWATGCAALVNSTQLAAGSWDHSQNQHWGCSRHSWLQSVVELAEEGLNFCPAPSKVPWYSSITHPVETSKRTS